MMARSRKHRTNADKQRAYRQRKALEKRNGQALRNAIFEHIKIRCSETAFVWGAIMNKPRLLDLFCGAGGCSVGYDHVGFTVTGVDHKPQKNYPLDFIQADALDYVKAHGHKYDVIHASPPCQRYSKATAGAGTQHSLLT